MSRRSRIVHSPPPPVADALVRFGRNIRRARQARGLTQVQLAESAGLSRHTVARVEHGSPGTAMSAYLTVMSALGILGAADGLADPDRDSLAAPLDPASLPRRGVIPSSAR